VGRQRRLALRPSPAWRWWLRAGARAKVRLRAAEGGLASSVAQALDRGHVVLGDGGCGQLDAAGDLGLDEFAEALALGDQLGQGDRRAAMEGF
jgi:hypothetical protein